MAFFDHPSHATAALTSCLAKNAADLQDLPNTLLTDGGRTMSAAIIGLIILFCYGWKVSLMLMPAMPLYVFALMFQIKALEGYKHWSEKNAIFLLRVLNVSFREE
ncbi:uncharacterized protein VTP21DRAFT_4290 [Calcarisporiella thermophila]|uniref:uncharacterized protein n=1 Tax=Calcarisporiella thermophila TaxID=911321 RepID=UPI00374311F9